jgi:hypothetical protein
MKAKDSKEYGREHNLPDLDTLPAEFWVNRIIQQCDEILAILNEIKKGEKDESKD